MTNKEFDTIRKGIFKTALNKKRKCFIEDCNATAIHSHLLQRRGILNNIITNGHLYEVVFLQYPQGHFNFRRAGWKDALTFPGFCKKHDGKIFERIEKNRIDFTDYQSLLMLLYRPLVHEYRQKEIVTEALVNTLSDSRMKQVNLALFDIQNTIDGETLLKWDMEFFILSLQADLANDTESFRFFTLSLPKIDVCVSSVISYQPLADSFLTDPINLEKKEPIASMLFSVIPTALDTKLIIGYHHLSEKQIQPKIDFFLILTQSELLKEVSDTLIRNCGTWSCSEHFFYQQIKPRIQSVLKLMNYFTRRQQFSKEIIPINLFTL